MHAGNYAKVIYSAEVSDARLVAQRSILLNVVMVVSAGASDTYASLAAAPAPVSRLRQVSVSQSRRPETSRENRTKPTIQLADKLLKATPL